MEDIELRSEQVRKLIGQIPPILIRSGISMIGIIITLLLVAAVFVPYPETVESKIILTDIQSDQVFATGELPYSYVSQIKNGMEVELELEGYASSEYNFQHSRIESVLPEVVTHNGKNVFRYTLVFKRTAFMQKGMKGEASILLSNKTLLQRIF